MRIVCSGKALCTYDRPTSKIRHVCTKDTLRQSIISYFRPVRRTFNKLKRVVGEKIYIYCIKETFVFTYYISRSSCFVLQIDSFWPEFASHTEQCGNIKATASGL